MGNRGAERRRLGTQGEALAAHELTLRGYRILARNLRTRRGELDLVAVQVADHEEEVVSRTVSSRAMTVTRSTVRSTRLRVRARFSELSCSQNSTMPIE